MQYRELGRTGYRVSTVSFGAWAIGGSWGPVQDGESLAALQKAVDLGVNFFDTADVYGDGRSERLLAQLKRERKEEIIIATKAGRRLERQTVEGYSRQNLTAWIERSLKNLNTETLDLVQLHCPPTEVFYRPEVFGILDDLTVAGKIRYLRRERRKGGGGAQGDRVPGGADGADHLQHLPPATGGPAVRGGEAAQGGDPGAGAAGFGDADGQADGAIRALRPTTTGRATGTASGSTGARLSRGWTTRRACRRWKSCDRWRRRATAWLSWRCAGS